jgi:hypothetical protein
MAWTTDACRLVAWRTGALNEATVGALDHRLRTEFGPTSICRMTEFRTGIGHDIRRLVPGNLDEMRTNIAAVVDIPTAFGSVKARSNDGIGPEGEGTACGAWVSVLVYPTNG